MNINDLAPVLPLVAGPALAVVTEAARRVPAVPFDPKTAAGMRLAVVALSLGAGAALAWLNGDLATFDWQAAGKTVWDAVIIYAAAVATHDHILDQPQVVK